jgi:hypothetical protein
MISKFLIKGCIYPLHMTHPSQAQFIEAQFIEATSKQLRTDLIVKLMKAERSSNDVPNHHDSCSTSASSSAVALTYSAVYNLYKPFIKNEYGLNSCL